MELATVEGVTAVVVAGADLPPEQAASSMAESVTPTARAPIVTCLPPIRGTIAAAGATRQRDSVKGALRGLAMLSA